MSATIDERVVEMKFDNSDFEKNVQTSMSTLDRLKQALKMDNARDSIESINRATRNLDFSGAASGIEVLKDRFSTLGVVGMSVIQNLTDKALNLGIAFATKIPSMITQGGWNRAMNIENAHFQLQGLIDDEKEVVAVMNQASESVNGTAYSYDAAAKAASMFAATGLKSGKEMENALKGIAGLAATTNSDYESISNIFTTVAGNGRLMGDQLNQLSYRGMNAAAALAKYFNGVRDGSIQASESVKKTLESITGSQSGIIQTAEEIQKSLDKQYEAAQKAYSKQYQAVQKTLNKEYKEYQKTLNKEYELKKEAYQKEYDALKESLDAEINAQKEANSKRIEEANDAYDRDVENYRKATDEKIALIDKEYAENLKLIDEEAYNRLKAIDDEINGINAQTEAEEKARKEQERANKLASLTQAVNSAKSVSARQKAEEALMEYQEKIAQEELAEQRKARINELREQKNAINEEKELKKEAAKEQRDNAVESVKEEYSAKMTEMQKRHKEEMSELQKNLNEQIEAMTNSRNDRLNSLKKSQNEELEVFKENQNEQLEIYKEKQNEQLEALREANNEKLKALKESLTEQTKATSKFSSAADVTEADIREMVSQGLISFDVFSEAMATTFGDHAKDANKTFNGALSNIRAALARTGEAFYKDIIVQEGPAVQLFNNIRIKINEMNKALADFASDSSKTINHFIMHLSWFVAKIPIDKITQIFVNSFKSIANIFSGIGSYIKPIMEAFRLVFQFDPDPIVTFSEKILDLTSQFKATYKETNTLRTTFLSIFSVIKSLIKLFGAFMKPIVDLLKPVKDMNNDFSSVFENIYNKLMHLNTTILSTKETQEKFSEVGKKVAKILKDTYDKISPYIPSLQDLADGLSKVIEIIGSGILIISNFVKNSEALQNTFKIIKELVTSIGKNALDTIVNFIKAVTQSKNIDVSGFSSLADVLNKLEKPLRMLKDFGITVFENLKKIVEPLGKALKDLGGYIWDILSSTNPLELLITMINTKLISGIGESIFGLLNTITTSLINTALASISSFILQLVGFFGNLEQLDWMADMIKKISEAILILAAAALVMASIPADDLGRATAAITAMITDLVAAFIMLRKFAGGSKMSSLGFDTKDKGFFGLFTKGNIKGFDTFYSIGQEIMEIAAAMLILAAACKLLASINVNDLVKGFTVVSAFLWEMTGIAIIINKSGADKGVAGVGGALLGMSVAILILTSAVSKFGQMDTEKLAQGVLAVVGLIAALTGFVKLSSGAEHMMAIGVGLLITAEAVKILVKSVNILSEMDIESAIQGVGAVGTLLLALGLFVKLAGNAKHMIAVGLGILEVAGALYVISEAIISLSEVDIDSLVMSVIALGILLGEIALVLNALTASDAIAGLGALEVAGALVLVAESLKKLDGMDMEGILVSVVALSAILWEIAAALALVPVWAPVTALGFIEVAASMVIAAVALKKMADIPADRILDVSIAMAAIIAEMIAALALVPPWAAATALGFIVVAAAMVLAAQALVAISAIDTDKMYNAVIGLGLVLAEMAIVVTAMGVVAPEALAGAGVMFVVAASLAASAAVLLPAIIAFADAIERYADIDSERFKDGVIKIGGVIALLGLSLKSFNLLAYPSAKALQVVADALLTLAPAIMMFSIINGKKLKDTFTQVAFGIAKFGLALKTYGILDAAKAAAFKVLATSISIFTPAIIALSLANLERVGEALTVLGKGMANFGKSLDQYKLLDALRAQALVVLADAINKLVPSLLMLSYLDGNKISDILIPIGMAFQNFGEALDATPFWAPKNRSEAILNLTEGVRMLADTLPKLVDLDQEKVSNVMTTIGYSFKAFSEALTGTPFWDPESRSDAIVNLTDGVKALGEALPSLVDLDQDKVEAVMTTIGRAFKDFSDALSNTPFWAPENRSEAINNLITGVQMLAETLPALTELDQEKMASSLSSIGTAFKDFSDALNNTPFWGPENRGNAIKILVGSIKELTDGLKYFIDAKMDPDSLATSIVTISSAFKQFGESLNSAPFWGVEDKGNAVATLSKSVKQLAEGLEYFIDHVDGEKVDDAITKVKDSFVAFSSALKGTPWFNVEGRADSIVTLVNSIETLANGISKFVELSGENGAQSMTDILSQVGTSLKDFGDAIKKTPFWGTGKRTDALINLIDNLTLIADVCAALKNVGSAQEVESLLSALSTGVTNMGTAIKEFRGVKESYIENLKTLCSVANDYIGIDTTSFSSSIDTFKKLYDVVSLLQTINTASLNAVVSVLSSFSSNVTQTSSAISVFVNTMVINLEQGVERITSAGSNMADAFFTGFINQSRISVIGTSLMICNLLATNLRVYSSLLLGVGQEHGTAYITGFAGVVLVQAMLVALTLVLGIIAELKIQGIMFRMAGEENGQNYVKGFTENLLRGLVLVQSTITMMLMTLKIMTIQFKTIGSDYAHAMITGSLTTIQKEFVLINNNILAILDKLNAYSNKFMIVGKSFTLSVFNGALMQFYAELPKVDNMIYRTIDALNTMTIKFRAIGQGYATNIIAAFSEMSEGFRVAGSNAAVGFVNGVYSRVGDARNAGYALGQAAYEAARSALDEHSPSRKMGEVGKFAGVGFINALSSYISDSYDVGEELGVNVTDGLTDSIAENIDLDIFSPTVKPIMDMSEVNAGANKIDNMFGTYKTMGLISDISFGDFSKQSMTDLMGSLISNSSSENTQVVESIESLRSDLASLSRVVSNLRVVMDTGSLVGAIAPSMDNALGQMAAYHERGMS